jgi:hypothetical protein
MRSPVAIVLLFAVVTSAAGQPATRPADVLQQRQAAVETAREELRAMGLPLTPKGFAAKLIGDPPPEVDAGPELLAAFAALPTPREASAYRYVDSFSRSELPRLDGEPARSWPEREEQIPWTTVAAAVEEHQASLAALDGIDSKLRPHVDAVQADLRIDYANPRDGLLLGTANKHLNDLRHLAVLHSHKLPLAVHEGRHDDAGRDIRRLLGIGDATDAAHPTVLGHLVGNGIRSLAAREVARVAPHLTFGDGERKLSRVDAKAIINLLMDTKADERRWKRAVAGEAAMQQNAVDHVIDGGGDSSIFRGNPLERMAIRSSASTSAVAMASITKLQYNAAEPSRLPRDVVEKLKKADRQAQTRPNQKLASIVLSATGMLTQSHYVARNTTRRAAVALALSMYQQDHGDLPAELETLVPEYLPRVPVDAMTVDEMIKYDRDRGIIWTVGKDGVDDGGFDEYDRRQEHGGISQRMLEEMGLDEVTPVKRPDEARP